MVPWGFIFTGSFRPCGTNGFVQKSSFIREEQLALFGHSDFNYKAHIEEYLRKRLPEQPHQLSVLHGRDIDEKRARKIFKETEKIDHQIYAEEYIQNGISLEKAIG